MSQQSRDEDIRVVTRVAGSTQLHLGRLTHYCFVESFSLKIRSDFEN